jgi:hypothetical protein
LNVVALLSVKRSDNYIGALVGQEALSIDDYEGDTKF